MINKTTLKFILGLKIKQLRAKADLSLKELAEKAGFSVSYLNEVEKGKKYPKVDKLASLAQALGIDMSELVSAKTGRNLHPLLNLLEDDVVKNVPLDLFGLTEQDLIDLMSVSPEKFASFVVTVLSISRSYDMKLEDLYNVALRATIEAQDNYFPEIEKAAKGFSKKSLDGQSPSVESLINILVNTYGYRIDEGVLTSKPQTSEVKEHAIRGKEPLLLLNKKLTERQKLYYLGREVGYQVLKDEFEPRDESKLAKLLFDFKISYFSGALMLEEKHLASSMKSFFSMSKFDGEAFLALMKSQNISTEVFFHRLTQVMPHHFGWKQLFFLRCNSKLDPKGMDTYNIAKELHLSRLHSPHGVRMGEHYCRRWITITLIQDLRRNIQEHGNSSRIAGAQISVMQNTGEEYLVLSIARPSKTKEGTLSCLTIGLKITDDVKKMVKFLSDPGIPRTTVAQTCQRCPIEDCKERIYPPVVVEAERRRQAKKDALRELDKAYL